MTVSLYLTDYEKEIIKNDLFYKLRFFDSINGYVFITYIHEKEMFYTIDKINNGNSETIDRLKKEFNK